MKIPLIILYFLRVSDTAEAASASAGVPKNARLAQIWGDQGSTMNQSWAPPQILHRTKKWGLDDFRKLGCSHKCRFYGKFQSYILYFAEISKMLEPCWK